MRTRLLGLSAAALVAGTLAVGVPAAPTHAVAWKAVTAIPFPAGPVTDLEVVSTGDGDAVAAAIIDGAVHAYTAVDGVWTNHSLVRAKVGATHLVLASNEKGDNAVGWVENVNGANRLRVSRQSSPDVWSGHLLGPMTPAGVDVVGNPQLAVSGDGLVITAASVDGGDTDHALVVTEWAKGGGSPGTPKTISSSDAWNPSLDVNSKGEALLAYQYTGLVDDVLTVSRRTPGKGWSLGDSTSNSGDIAAAPDVAIAENGQGQVIYGVVAPGGYLAETSRVLASGVALDGEILSSTSELISEPTVDMDAAGTALFAWIGFKDATRSVRYATAAPGADPGTAQTLAGALPDAEHPIARINGALRVIQHTGNGKVTTHLRTTAALGFNVSTTGNGYAPDSAVDVDQHGNATMAGIQANTVQARFLDAGAPSLTLTKPGPANNVSLTVPLAWSASDALSALKPGTDVYLSKSRWDQATFTAPAVVVDGAPGTTASYAALPGATYCFQARVLDTANNGSTSAKRCTTVPLDDKALAGSGWTRQTHTGQFKGTWTTTTTKGRVLTRTGIKAKRLALVVQRVPKGGTVRVTWNGTTIKNLSLKGKAANRVVLPIASWQNVRSGTLRIKVTSANGLPVRIDGLVVAK